MAHDDPANWWRDAVIYQVYIRSFADGDGDGLGDIAGLRSRLGYLADLGVDALWINPWYPSPMADAGYDVADYRAVEPRFGSLEDAEALLREAHEARAAGAARHRAQPHLGPARLVRRGAGGRTGLTGPGPLRVPARPGRRGRPAAERVAERLRRLRLAAGDRARRDAGGVVPPPVRPRAAGRQLGAPRGPRRLRGDPALLVRPGRRRLPDRRRALAGQAGRPARRRRTWSGPASRWRSTASCDAPRGSRTRSGTATRCTRSTATGAASRTPTTRPGCSWPRPGSTSRSGSPATCAPTSCTPRSTSPTSQAPWDAGYLRHVISRDPRRARRRRGAGDVGAVQPRRGPARLPLRPRAGRARQQPDAAARAGPPTWSWGVRRARAAVLLTLGAARQRLRLPGRGARAARGRGPPRGRARRPDLGALRAHRARAATAAGCRCRGRAPGRRTASARTGVTRPAVAAAARRLGRPHRRGRVRGPRLDARAVPLGAAAAPRDARLRRRVTDLAGPARRACSGSPGSPGWPAW